MKLLSFFILSCSALYFEISQRDKKCFIEELPDDTQMIGKYLVQVYDKEARVSSAALLVPYTDVLFRPGKNLHQDLACM